MKITGTWMEKKNYLMQGPGFTRFIFLNDRPPDGKTWSGGATDEDTNNLSSRQCMARYVETYVTCIEKESKTKLGCRETKA